MVRKTGQILDEILILSAKKGDLNALSLLIKRWEKPIKSFIYKIINQPSPVNDISQEVWKTVFENIKKLKDPTSYKSWMFRIAYNKSMDWLRSKHTEQPIDGTLEVKNESDDTSSDLEAHLRNCLKKLPPQHYSVLKLHYLEELSLTEMATILNIPVGTVKSKLFYAREKLKAIIKQYPYENE